MSNSKKNLLFLFFILLIGNSCSSPSSKKNSQMNPEREEFILKMIGIIESTPEFNQRLYSSFINSPRSLNLKLEKGLFYFNRGLRYLPAPSIVKYSEQMSIFLETHEEACLQLMDPKASVISYISEEEMNKLAEFLVEMVEYGSYVKHSEERKVSRDQFGEQLHTLMKYSDQYSVGKLMAKLGDKTATPNERQCEINKFIFKELSTKNDDPQNTDLFRTFLQLMLGLG